MHAMSKMARKDGREGALHYFDLTQVESVRLLTNTFIQDIRLLTFMTFACVTIGSIYPIFYSNTDRSFSLIKLYLRSRARPQNLVHHSTT